MFVVCCCGIRLVVYCVLLFDACRMLFSRLVFVVCCVLFDGVVFCLLSLVYGCL